MAFKGLYPVETREEEQARLASSPEGSIYERCSHLPVTLPHPDIDMLVELPQLYSIKEQPEQWRIIGLLKEYTPGLRGRKILNGTWTVTVVASTHPSYPVRCWDISVSEAQVRRARQITPETLLWAAKQGEVQ